MRSASRTSRSHLEHPQPHKLPILEDRLDALIGFGTRTMPEATFRGRLNRRPERGIEIVGRCLRREGSKTVGHKLALIGRHALESVRSARGTPRRRCEHGSYQQQHLKTKQQHSGGNYTARSASEFIAITTDQTIEARTLLAAAAPAQCHSYERTRTRTSSGSLPRCSGLKQQLDFVGVGGEFEAQSASPCAHQIMFGRQILSRDFVAEHVDLRCTGRVILIFPRLRDT